jgi:hypothetical protein
MVDCVAEDRRQHLPRLRPCAPTQADELPQVLLHDPFQSDPRACNFGSTLLQPSSEAKLPNSTVTAGSLADGAYYCNVIAVQHHHQFHAVAFRPTMAASTLWHLEEALR